MPFTAPDADLVADDPPATQGGGSPVPSTAPVASSGGFSAPDGDVLNEQGHTPMEAAHAYLDAAGDGLPASLDRSGSWQDQAEQHYQAAKAYWDQNPLVRLEDSAGGTWTNLKQHPLATAEHAWNATSGAVSNLYGQAKQGTVNAWNETTADFHDHPFAAPAHLLASVAVGGLEGLYGLRKLGSEAVGKVSDVAASASPAKLSDPEAAGRYRATRDYLLRRYNQDVEAPAKANIRAASPLPAVQDAAEVVAPALVPVAGEKGLVARGADLLANAVPKVSGRVLQATGKLGEVAAEHAPQMGTAAAVVNTAMHGGLGTAATEFAAGIAGNTLKPVAAGLKNVGQRLATNGSSTAVRAVAAPTLKAGLRTSVAVMVDGQKPLILQPFTAPPEELVTE